MTDPETDPGIDQPAPPQAEDLLGLNPDLARSVAQALAENHPDDASALIRDLHAAEVANLIEMLKPDQRLMLVELLRPRFDPEILTELDETFRDDMAGQLGTDVVAAAIARLDTDDALELIAELTEDKQRRVLQAMPDALRAILEEGLAFPEDSAGRLMQRAFVAVPTFWTVGDTIDFMRESDDLPNDFYDLFVVDPRHRLAGKVPLNRLLRTKRPVRISDIMEKAALSIPLDMDQEEVAYVFAQQNIVSAPVVDAASRLIGVIMVDDILDVIHEEAEEDIMRLGGVREDDLYAAVIDTGRSRFSWLFLNLLTAVLASVVIGFFETTIQKIVILAVLMPIAASMGGNAGTQTLTVVVRALAMKELTRANAMRVVSKEILVGVFNGILFAVLMGLIAWVWSGDWAVGLVMASAMVVTLMVAGLAGTSIPLALARTGVDPAVASGVFLTTVTDVVAFLAFLGLAAAFLL